MKKALIRTFVAIFVIGIIFASELNVFADLGGAYNPDLIPESHSESGFETKVTNIGKGIARILQIIATVGVVITGFKYMTSADASEKSKIKETLIWMCVGLLFVTSANAIISLVARAGQQALR